MAIAPIWLLDAIVVGVLVTLVAMLAMNRGDRTVVNLSAQDEPVVVGGGVALAVVGWHFNSGVWMALGAIVALVGVLSRYTDWWDLSEVVP